MKKDVVKDIMERNGSSVVCGFFSCAVNSMISENFRIYEVSGYMKDIEEKRAVSILHYFHN